MESSSRAVRRRSVTLETALGGIRPLATILAFVELRDLEACACTSSMEPFTGLNYDAVFFEQTSWSIEFEELEAELAQLHECSVEEWEETFRAKFLRLYTLGLWTNERTFLSVPVGVPDDSVGLEAEADRLRAANLDGLESERSDFTLLESSDFTLLEVAKLAARARRWADPFGQGFNAFEKEIPPGWTLPPLSARRVQRISPFNPVSKYDYSCMNSPRNDIIYWFQGEDCAVSREQHRDAELRAFASVEFEKRVPCLGTSLLNLGGATNSELAREIQADRQRHAATLAAEMTDRRCAELVSTRARKALGLEASHWMDGWMDRHVCELIDRGQAPYYEVSHENMFDIHRDVVAEASSAGEKGHLPEALVRSVRERFIPLANYKAVDAALGPSLEHASIDRTVVFTFASKTALTEAEVKTPDLQTGVMCRIDQWDECFGVEFMLRTHSYGGDGVSGFTGDLLVRDVRRGISGAFSERDAHHVWKFNDSCSGEGPPAGSSDYAEGLRYRYLHRCILGYEWGSGPKLEPNQILRTLLLCAGYKFSDAALGSNQHRHFTILPRSATTAGNTSCVSGWGLLQQEWGAAHAGEDVFAVDDPRGP